ncbi:conserved hypothetical protein, secreted [Candidatus Magnetomorum sp. HK-1]|nr:conserved hypothetical protein, secreted [Candidatus Magnetomorum sp. HK-1]
MKSVFQNLLNFDFFVECLFIMILISYSNANANDAIEQLHIARDAFIEHFRINGTLEPEKASVIEEKLKLIIEKSEGEQHARALFELATIQRITNKFELAIQNYDKTVKAAEVIGLKEIIFDAWIGLARSYTYGIHNHGAAVDAFNNAVTNAGIEPTEKQNYDIADYSSQIQAGYGDLEAALVNALAAIRYAKNDSDLFYAQLDAGDVFMKFAESCDYRSLIDSKSLDDKDSWGACRRSVNAAKFYYMAAKKTAQKLGWNFLVNQTEGFISQLEMRLFLIEQKASVDKITGVFKAQDVHDVLVNENFSAGATGLTTGNLLIGELIDAVVPESKATDPRNIYLRGLKADSEGKPEEALTYFKRAAKLLLEERLSLFDPMRRGTVIENRPELIRDLAIRFLALRQFDDAFMTFESIRAHGLGAFSVLYDQISFTNDARNQIAKLIQLESQASAIQTKIVEDAIAGGGPDPNKQYDELNQIRKESRKLLMLPEMKDTVKKIFSVTYSPSTLGELQQAVIKSNIPVFLFWVTHTNVIVWVVSPKGIEVKTVFLPEVAVIDKVMKITDSASKRTKIFDEISARELHTYLIKPFSKYLTQEQLIIIPHGTLVDLPFEVLIDTETGDFFAKKIAVSYAPNVSFAIKSLNTPISKVSKITAIYETETIENSEIPKIKNIKELQVDAHLTKNLGNSDIIKLLGQTENVHVLLHGEYNIEDPLQSAITVSGMDKITAAELLAVNWRDTRLAVFSSCEGARLKTRISNELFGIPWTLLAGGVDHVVLSRWRGEPQHTAEWMEIFYSNLATGKGTPAMAANAAMKKFIINHERPYFWAGHRVFGR